MATPDQDRNRRWRRRHLIQLAVAVVAVVAVGNAFSVDQLLSDGIVATTPVSNQDLAFGNVCPGQTYPSPSAANVALAIERGTNATNAFDNNAEVTIGLQATPVTYSQPTTNGTLAATIASPGTITLPATWTTNGALSSSLSSTVTLTVPAGATAGGPYAASVKYTSSGNQQGGGTLTRNHDQPVTWTVLSATNAACAPSDAIAPTASPTQSPAANGAGWNNSNVTVTWNWTDNAGGSGIDSANCTTSSTSSGEGTIILNATCKDLAGNTGNASYTVKVDTTKPTISAAATTSPNGAGWYNGDVTVAFTCADAGGSDIPAGACPAGQTLNTQGAAVSSSAQTVTDAAGNTSDASNVVTVKIDKTAPSVTYTSASPSPNGAGWNNTDVVATFTATDTLSGFAGSSTTKTGTSTTSSQGLAVTVGSPAFTDLAGNTAPADTATSDAFMIDKTNPSVLVTGVSNGATYTLGSVPATGCSTSDSLSGVKTNASLLVSGGTVNGVGSFTATCNGAKDNADNSQAGPVSASYSVIYDPAGISGILQPINSDNSSVFSRGKAVPVKFQLAGDEYTGFNFSAWKLNPQQTSCTIDGDPVGGELEPVVENPSNAFRYDAAADQYIYNANFKSMVVGTCWKVVVTLDSGQKLSSAVFKLQK